MVEIRRYRELPSVPWKNGAGETRQVALAPAGGTSERFDWRLSIATIEQSGAFSSYPGIDRRLVNCGEGAVELDIAGSKLVLEKHEQAMFRGEDAITATLRDGPTRDLNLMTRRSACVGEIRIRLSDGAMDAWHPSLRAVVLLDGSANLGGADLGPLDSIVRSEVEPGVGVGAELRIRFRSAVVAEVSVHRS